MTRIIATIAAAILTAMSVYAQENTDTTTTSSKRAVIYELTDGSTVVEVTDANGVMTRTPLSNNNTEDVDYISIKSLRIPNHIRMGSKYSRWDLKCGGFNFGWNFAPGHPGNMPVEAGKSFEIGWFELIGVEYKAGPTTSFNLGFGMDWRNYKISTPDYRFVGSATGGVEMTPYPEGSTPRNSRIKIFTLSMPLMIKQKMPFRLFGSQQWLAVGASLGYSPHGSILTRWSDESGHKDKQSNSKIGHRRWSYELIGMAGISSQVAVYLRYQPMSVLSGAGQPDFKSLSTGLIFFY